MWYRNFLISSIGKKFVMAATGLFLVFFLFVHVIGNSLVFFGSEVFQTYANVLHAIPLVVILFSLLFFGALFAHMGYGLFLFFENRTEGNDRYAVNVRTVKNSLASKTMPYTGLFIFFFLIIHLTGFTFSGSDAETSALVQDRLSSFAYGLFYLISFGVLYLHLSHGFWSMLQTFGMNHPRYNPYIAKLTIIVPAFFNIVFALVALYFMTGIGTGY